MSTSQRPDAFPQTLGTWIGSQLDQGDQGRLDVNQHIMAVYARPLTIYLRGSSWNRFGEADEVINGFFASRLDKPEFFEQWKASGKRLRYWLINALRFHLQESWRRTKRNQSEPLPDFDQAPSQDDYNAFDRAWARECVQSACREACDQCATEGLDVHWSIFHQHHIEGTPYRQIAAELDISPGRCAVMVRTATSRFKESLLRRLALDGMPDDGATPEIDKLMEVLG